jgi:hypothetical protein
MADRRPSKRRRSLSPNKRQDDENKRQRYHQNGQHRQPREPRIASSYYDQKRSNDGNFPKMEKDQDNHWNSTDTTFKQPLNQRFQKMEEMKKNRGDQKYESNYNTQGGLSKVKPQFTLKRRTENHEKQNTNKNKRIVMGQGWGRGNSTSVKAISNKKAHSEWNPDEDARILRDEIFSIHNNANSCTIRLGPGTVYSLEETIVALKSMQWDLTATWKRTQDFKVGK